MSFYLDRVKECMNQPDNRYDQIGSSNITRWYNSSILQTVCKVTLREITFTEETYKGYQIIVIGWHRDLQTIYDLNGGLVISHTNIQEDQISRYGDPERRSSYSAYAWKIGATESVANLKWIGQLTTLNGICSSSKEQTTMRSAKKKLDLRAKVDAVKDDLIATSNDRMVRNSGVNPYNAQIGDQPFIQAFGRLRRGKIVDTVGSRFIVAYCTPSNTDELKYKALPLSQLWVESGWI